MGDATDDGATTAAPSAADDRKPVWRDPLALIVRFQSLIGLVLVLVGGVAFSPVRRGQLLFLTPDNVANIIRAISETGIIALGMTFVIITAGIDLSVGAVLGLSSVLTATLLVNFGWGIVATLLAVIAAGTAFGALQGLISARFRLEAFIVTLAGLQVARGLALVFSHNQYINISYGEGEGLAPPAFSVLGDRLFGNVVPVATLVFLILAVVATLVLNFTRFGRYVYAVGGNERAARLSGIPVGRIRIAVYAITGFAASAAGIVHAGQFSFGSPNDGAGYELTAIAAVVIGGTSLFGGMGTMFGTVIGVFIPAVLKKGFDIIHVQDFWQLIAVGAVLVAVVWFDQRRRSNRDR
jgi:ribose transport system permease protein